MCSMFSSRCFPPSQRCDWVYAAQLERPEWAPPLEVWRHILLQQQRQQHPTHTPEAAAPVPSCTAHLTVPHSAPWAIIVAITPHHTWERQLHKATPEDRSTWFPWRQNDFLLPPYFTSGQFPEADLPTDFLVACAWAVRFVSKLRVCVSVCLL